ncbi:NTP transferase domain-containing protein [Enterocloster bolteae]|uniref:NTP transferase domain-containing protein n=1 Tax=Enterocloster bolteae TaxID=208479 RepID=UPI00189EA145|nr:NTP transferase domain-containing protein [Enterocloster bolteae]
MNKIMFDILMYLNDNTGWDSRAAARKLYKPYSVIDAEFERLNEEGYAKGGIITEKGVQYLERHKVDNAIILAAGVSSRFVPLCFERPKGLLPVNGEVLIERQIRQLHEKGITDITIVVGFMKDKFYYLQEKYGVNIIETGDYRIRNNHASIWAARKKLGNTIITSSDLYFNENIFQSYAYDAFYCSVYKEGATEERGIQTDGYDKILATFYDAADTWVTLGYAYFNRRFTEKFIEILSWEFDKPQTICKFWADIQDEHLSELYMYAKRVDSNVIYEFDCLEELREFDNTYFVDSGSKLMKMIASELNTTEGELSKFAPITKEDLSKGFTFTFQQKKYICKINSELEILEVRRYDDKLQELVNITESFTTYYNRTLPLCAAENVISDFGNMPLSMGFQERYIVGNTYSYLEDNNFIGSTYLLPFYEMISEECREIFNAKYTDARTLTGMNCLMVVLMSLAKIGDSIMILSSQSGGHASVKPICERLGLKVSDVPYDFQNFDLDYEKLNHRLKEGQIDYILLAPSDIISPLEVNRIELGNTVLLYDVSQMLGLIGAGVIENPLAGIKNIVMFGGTHKTFPGPACGLIMTNNDELHAKLETTINPIYIRHTQMHQKVSLLFTLIEFENFGQAYQEHIVTLANELGKNLKELGMDIAMKEGTYSKTHQVFIRTDKNTMNRIFENSLKYGITLNKKNKELFSGSGIRLGTQEIARYNWPVESMKDVAQIIQLISEETVNVRKLMAMLNGLPQKKIQFTFDEGVRRSFGKYL